MMFRKVVEKDQNKYDKPKFTVLVRAGDLRSNRESFSSFVFPGVFFFNIRTFKSLQNLFPQSQVNAV